jgi:hypothetical protein
MTHSEWKVQRALWWADLFIIIVAIWHEKC